MNKWRWLALSGAGFHKHRVHACRLRHPLPGYTIFCMTGRYEIELEPEVRDWLETLPVGHYLRVMQRADDLADAPETFGEPRSRHLGGPVRELRVGDW